METNLIGRNSELALIERMVRNGRHVLLEGPVGVGKTTLALEAAARLGRKTLRVDGDGRYTEQKLVGAFDPKLVLERGFVRESFLPGPLFQAMEEGALLLINELNRMPEMVQNVLLPALDEGKIQLPVLGELRAKPGFTVLATQNPREFVATSALSEALLDRLEWIAIQPLSPAEEVEAVRAHLKDPRTRLPLEAFVELVRLTREHPKVKRGASLRAAIAMAQVLEGEERFTEELFFEVARSVLANRMELQTGKFSSRPYIDLLNEVMGELWESLKKKP